MINCVLEDLPSADQQALRLWLSKGALPLFLKVVDARVKESQALFLKNTMQAEDQNQKAEAARVYLEKAKQFQSCYDTILQFADGTLPFQAAKLN